MDNDFPAVNEAIWVLRVVSIFSNPWNSPITFAQDHPLQTKNRSFSKDYDAISSFKLRIRKTYIFLIGVGYGISKISIAARFVFSLPRLLQH